MVIIVLQKLVKLMCKQQISENIYKTIKTEKQFDVPKSIYVYPYYKMGIALAALSISEDIDNEIVSDILVSEFAEPPKTLFKKVEKISKTKKNRSKEK